jgi:hypothetical protein
MESLILISQPDTMLMVAGYVFTLGIIREHIIRGVLRGDTLIFMFHTHFFHSFYCRTKARKCGLK